MKLFKKRRDPARASEVPPSPSSTSSSSSSCAAAAGAAASVTGVGVRTPTSTSPAATSAATAASGTRSPSSPSPAGERERSDYITSEEDFQMQLALAISNSECGGDPDGDQIRAATLLSLRNQRVDRAKDEGCSADSLSRRYWECNVLDYGEKVVDGFYDILGFCGDPVSCGKMPSLVDLQNGDLGFEVIVVNHAIDNALIELEQVAQCIKLDCPVGEVGLLVQRISELVADHMAGPVRDANDMLARWLEKSTELRTSLQTSLLPIGCIQIGLSRHRALLFKVLADNVGISCRLVKGSHYTGIDYDAVNIIKMDNDREFLVDLMAAPGTLIPQDVLSARDASLNSYNPKLSHNPWSPTTSSNDILSLEASHGENESGVGTSASDGNKALNEKLRNEKGVIGPYVPSAPIGPSSSDVGSSSSRETMNTLTNDQVSWLPSPANASFKQKGILEVRTGSESSVTEKLNVVQKSEDEDLRNLFSELNPFQQVGFGKASMQYKGTDNRKSEYQKRRENVATGPGRPPQPLVWKNRPACNEVPNAKQSNFVEGLFPRKDVGYKDYNPSSSHTSSSSGVKLSDSSNVNDAAVHDTSYSAGIATSATNKNDSSPGNSAWPPHRANNSRISSGVNRHGKLDIAQANEMMISAQSSEKSLQENHMHAFGSQSSIPHGLKEPAEKINGKHDRQKYTDDRFIGTDVPKDIESYTSPSETRQSRLDPMLDDVAEWEIPWEDLHIGERIGLGSYGEVYRADWNGTEVAVKKFLDQDFYGGALDEFRSEVRIMRRLLHPNVVRFMGAVTRPPNLSIVSEFLPRGSLYRMLHRPYCQIDEKRRIKMALDVAKGMSCLHSSSPTIVHRDLKSPNLLVDKNWTVKVCDFGLSRLKHNTFLSSKSTAGTPEWMAPEVLRNEPSNEKCDVYSFGVILWELATLRMPWSGMNPMQVVGAVGFQNRRLDIPKEVDPLVARIIWECWQTEPNLRPSFAQLITALQSLQQLVIPSQQDAQSPPVTQEISVDTTPRFC